MYFYILTVLFSVLSLFELTLINVRRKKYKELLKEEIHLVSVLEPFDINRIIKQPTFKAKFKLPAVKFLVLFALSVVSFVLSFVF